jgi:hypothetical protein
MNTHLNTLEMLVDTWMIIYLCNHHKPPSICILDAEASGMNMSHDFHWEAQRE